MRDQCSVPIAGENSQVRGEAVALTVGSRDIPIWHITTGNAGLICCLTWVVCVQMQKGRLFRKEKFKSVGQTRAEKDVGPTMQWGREISSRAVKWWRTAWKKAQMGNFDYTVLRQDKVNWGNSDQARYLYKFKREDSFGSNPQGREPRAPILYQSLLQNFIWPWIKSPWLSLCHSSTITVKMFSLSTGTIQSLRHLSRGSTFDTFLTQDFSSNRAKLIKASWNQSDICRKPHLGVKGSREQLCGINQPGIE